MENKSLTAIEWLKAKLEDFGDPRVCEIEWKDLDLLLEQAKQVEKEQMIEFAEFVATHPDKNKNYLGGDATRQIKIRRLRKNC